MQRLLAILLLFVVSCASAPDPTRSGPRRHLGFEFPEDVAGFQLQEFEKFDDPRLGAVANYRLSPRDPLLVSAYVFPPPEFANGDPLPIATHAREELGGLLQHYEGGRQIEWPPAIVYDGRSGRQTYQAALEIAHPDLGEVYSLLVLQEVGDARLKLRVSFSASDPDAGYAVARFLDAFL